MYRSSDSASININIPPKAIDAFFNGWAQVEKSKHPPPSPSADWSSVAQIISAVAPSLIQLLQTSCSKSCSSKPHFHRKRRSYRDSLTPSEESENDDNDDNEENEDVTVNFIIDPDGTVHGPKSTEGTTSESKDENTCKENECKDCKENNCVETVSKTCDESCMTKCEPKLGSEDECKVKTEDIKPKSKSKPKYTEGENISLNLGPLTKAFASNGGQGGNISDMMKSFGPMFEEIMGSVTNLNNLQKTVEKSLDKTSPTESTTATTTDSETMPELESE